MTFQSAASQPTRRSLFFGEEAFLSEGFSGEGMGEEDKGGWGGETKEKVGGWGIRFLGS